LNFLPVKKKTRIFFFSLSTGFVINAQDYLYHYWLGIISLAVAYNLLLIPARYCFDDLDKNLRILWISLDYTFDFIYLIDIFLQSRIGENEKTK
jgi:hypothetical protein